MEWEIQPYKIYARCDRNGNVVRFLTTFYHSGEIEKTDVFVEEGFGEDYGNFQARTENRLDIMDERLVYLWEKDGEKVRKKTEEEIEAELAQKPKPGPTEEEEQSMAYLDFDYRLSVLELGL